jgi:hypothetical protein
MTTQYVSSAWLEGSSSGGRIFLKICFWLWGLAGLVISTLALLQSLQPQPIFQFPSPASLLYWIGGMLLFGLGALQADSNYDFKRRTEIETGGARVAAERRD